VIKDVMRQLSFKKAKLDGEAGFGDVAGSGIDSSRTHEPIVKEVRTQEPIVKEVIVEDYIVHMKLNMMFSLVKMRVQMMMIMKTIIFLVDKENKSVELDVDVHLFGISMDVPFDSIDVTNLVSDDVLEEKDVDVINPNGSDCDLGNDNKISNYKRRRLAELSREMEGVINASGQRKYSFYIEQKFTSAKEAKDKVYLHSIKSRRNLKLY
nr:hypothetical protein [Tanacetum cinerariifolium]